MLATLDQTETSPRLYFGRGNSIISYFTPRSDGHGCELCLEPGFHAYPRDFEMHRDEVRLAVLAEAALRLGVAVGEVLALPFTVLQGIADPDVPEKYRFATRRRGRPAR